MTFATLPTTWQSWIVDNLERACTPQSIAEVMIREGQFEPEFTRGAIEEAIDRVQAVESRPLDMPFVDCSENSIRCTDRTIEVLMHCGTPNIVLLGNVLNAEECDSLVALGEPRLEQSSVVDDGDGSMRPHESRTSRGAMIERGETELVHRIEQRLSELANWPAERGEALQVQHYGPGHEYRPHFDWFDGALPGPRKQMEHGGQRLATFVLYLSDVESGGATSFPALGLEIRPRKGHALFFRNTDARGVPERRTLHAGEPVVRGTKTIANKWLRAERY